MPERKEHKLDAAMRRQLKEADYSEKDVESLMRPAQKKKKKKKKEESWVAKLSVAVRKHLDKQYLPPPGVGKKKKG